jgi:zinc D-Ala-D-Ala dipeptidase
MIAKIQRMSYKLKALILLFLPLCSLKAQSTDTSRYGVPLVNRISQYSAQVAAQADKEMVELKQVIPDLVYELRYAGKNNFTRQVLYPVSTRHTFLRKPAAEALARVQAELRKQNRGLKIFDAYRPYSVTVKFWELIGDERYVAHPAKASGHNRGLAVDLTIIDLKTQQELDMGTGFDDFSDTAHHTFTSLPQSILENRAYFRALMEKQGFRLFETEWWHYSWPNDKGYEALNLPFPLLWKAARKKKNN